ncbi:MAG: hypothetical protein ACI8X5_004153 [Planctomycetota bacterium]|jgi:hypothetical protein
MSHTQYVSAGNEVSTVEFVENSGQGETIVGHVYANTWGLYTFAVYPYLAGGIDENGEPVWDYFSDVANVETAVALLRAEALRHGATHVIDLKSEYFSEWSPSTLIFWIVESSVSATAIRAGSNPPPGAIRLESFRN